MRSAARYPCCGGIAAVMMPRGSADVRGEQLAALETEHHALLTTPKVARLLERAGGGIVPAGGLAARQPP